MRLVGVDEAGRGPVIGPMVMASVMADAKIIDIFEELGIKDSKLLTKEKREELYVKIIELAVDYKIKILSTDEIDAALNDEKMNLNKLEAHATADMLNELVPDHAIIDLPDKNSERYCSYIKDMLNVDVELQAEHKADLNHTIVGAASILAKVTRDREIENLQKSISDDMGSGYMSDQKTKDFLLKNWETFPHFRKSWSSWSNLKKDKDQKKLGDF